VPRPLLIVPTALAVLALLTGCGGSSDNGSGARDLPAPPATAFPAAQGKSLGQVLSASTGEGPVVSPAQRVLRLGENRFTFGVFTTARDPIDDAQVAIYAAPGAGLKGPAAGPFPAKVIDLTTEPAYRAKTTTDDPDAAQVAYVAEIDLDRPGPWTFGALEKNGATFTGSLVATPSRVGEFDPPSVGDPAPAIHTPTADEVPDVSEIDTRIPPDDMHRTDLADVLGKKPAVLLFATPALCQSRVCGPVVDVEDQVEHEYGDRVAFIHQEIYENNQVNDGTRPQVNAYRLPSEPWLFVIDRTGRISTVIEGPFSVAELEAAVRKVAGQ
jgi:hypothetical protein